MSEVKVNPNELTTSTRKRPNKAKILKQATLRGHLTPNENLMITGLTVKKGPLFVNDSEFRNYPLELKIDTVEQIIQYYDTDCAEYKKWQEKIIVWKEKISCANVKN